MNRETNTLCLIGTVLAVTVIIHPVLAEPLAGSALTAHPPSEPSAIAAPLVPTKPVNRPDAHAVLEDRNNNHMADGLDARLSAAAAGEQIDVAVLFETPAHAAAARKGASFTALRYSFGLIPGFSARMTAAQVRALAARPGVIRIEEVFPVHASLETARRDFGIDRVAPSLGYSGNGVGICIVDTGIFPQHEQFLNAAGTSKVVGFRDCSTIGTSTTTCTSPAPFDDHGHGTHVASIAAGDGTGSDPAFADHYHGVAPGAVLYGAKVLDAEGSGTSDAVVAGVDWCADQPGVRVINLSLGSEGSSDGNDVLSQAVDAAVVNKGKVVVVGAGNGGAASKTIGSPAAARQAITVGAAAEWSTAWLVEGESDGVYIAPFSSRGPTADSRIKPDITAPGYTIIAAYPDFWGGALGCTNDCYAVLSGTSMASPFVAGTAALMLEANSALTSAGVSNILAATARDRGPKGSGGTALKDNTWGYGLLDGYAAVAQAAVQAGNTADTTPTAFPSYAYGTASVRGSGPTRIGIKVTDTSAPLAVTVTILDGGLKLFCDIFFGCVYEWRPDYDVRLLDPSGGEVASGICMLGLYYGQECDNYGRQETMHIQIPVAGTYTLEVYKGTNDSRNGKFSYEVSRGPLVGGVAP